MGQPRFGLEIGGTGVMSATVDVRNGAFTTAKRVPATLANTAGIIGFARAAE